MSKWRRAAKIDENQRQIVSALRKIPGVTVSVGHDDILCGYRGLTYWFEIKNPDQVKKNGEFKAGALKATQHYLLDNWTGDYHIVSSLDKILEIIGIENQDKPPTD